MSVGLAVSSALLLVLGNYWKRRKYVRESAPVIKHFVYDKRKANFDIPSGNGFPSFFFFLRFRRPHTSFTWCVSVSSFRIFRTGHRSLSPSIKSTNRQASVISSIQDSPSHCKSPEVKYTAPQQLGVMGETLYTYYKNDGTADFVFSSNLGRPAVINFLFQYW